MGHTYLNFDYTHTPTSDERDIFNRALSYLDRVPNGYATLQQTADRHVKINFISDLRALGQIC